MGGKKGRQKDNTGKVEVKSKFVINSKTWLPTILSITGVIGVTLTSSDRVIQINDFFKKNFLWMMLASIVFAVSGEIWKAVQTWNYEKFKKEFDEQKTYVENSYGFLSSIPNVLVENLFNSLSLKMDERITIYIRYDHGFKPLARFSTCPLFNKGTDTIFPEGKGIIWEAYQKGELFIEDLPDPINNFNDWLDEQKKLGITKQMAKKLTMKSRSYFAKAFIQKGIKDPHAIIVFESITPHVFIKENLVNAIASNQFLVEYLEQMHEILPDWELAKKTGY